VNNPLLSLAIAILPQLLSLNDKYALTRSLVGKYTNASLCFANSENPIIVEDVPAYL